MLIIFILYTFWKQKAVRMMIISGYLRYMLAIWGILWLNKLISLSSFYIILSWMPFPMYREKLQQLREVELENIIKQLSYICSFRNGTIFTSAWCHKRRSHYSDLKCVIFHSFHYYYYQVTVIWTFNENSPWLLLRDESLCDFTMKSSWDSDVTLIWRLNCRNRDCCFLICPRGTANWSHLLTLHKRVFIVTRQ